MIPKLLSITKVSMFVLLAMTCVSCAHQAKTADLMIDNSAPSDDHVWSESREVRETVAAAENKSEEEAELEQSNQPLSEATEKSELVASGDTQPSLVDESQKSSSINSESKTETSREMASEPPSEEVNPPSRVEPTIGVPGRLKNNDNLVPSKKFTEKNRTSSNQRENPLTLPKNEKLAKTQNQEPVVEIVPEAEMLERVVSSPAEPSVNALGEEESSPQLASVEIANFVQRHWFATLVLALIAVGTLYFTVGRKRDEDSQSI